MEAWSGAPESGGSSSTGGSAADIAPRTGGGSRGRKIDRGRLAELAKAQPDATLVELRDRLGVKVTAWAVGKALRELGLSYKKSRPAPPSRTARTSRGSGPSGR